MDPETKTVPGPPLTIGKTTYEVRLVPTSTDEEFRAWLVGPRGATYGLLSNKRDPSLCFPVAENMGRRVGGAIDKLWFKLVTDATGQMVAVVLR